MASLTGAGRQRLCLRCAKRSNSEERKEQTNGHSGRLRRKLISWHKVRVSIQLTEDFEQRFRMTELSLDLPDMIPQSIKDCNDEAFIQSQRWIPMPPDRRPGQTLNLPSFWENYAKSAKMTKDEVECSSTLNRPVYVAMLSNSPVVRVTAWVDTGLHGLTFHFLDPDSSPSVSIGGKFGYALDCPINGQAGERIIGLHALSCKKGTGLIGVRVSTQFPQGMISKGHG